MPLLYPDTKVSQEGMSALFRDFLQELSAERKLLENPPAPVLEPHRLQNVRQLVDDLLALLEAIDPKTLPREDLRRWVNLQYGSSQVVVDCLKTCLEMPKVPRPRSRPAPPAEAHRDPNAPPAPP